MTTVKSIVSTIMSKEKVKNFSLFKMISYKLKDNNDKNVESSNNNSSSSLASFFFKKSNNETNKDFPCKNNFLIFFDLENN